MTNSSDRPISAIRVSPESARVIEASIAAATSGLSLGVLAAMGVAASAVLLCVGLGMIAFGVGAALGGQGVPVAALAFGVPFSLVAGVILFVQLKFLRNIRQRQEP